MAKLALDVDGALALLQHQRGEGVTQAVGCEAQWQLGVLQGALEGFAHPAMVERLSG